MDPHPGDRHQPAKTHNTLTRKTTEEGKSYNHYTYLGGETKASLPAHERAKLVVTMFGDAVTMVRAQQWNSDCLDSIIYLATRSQPSTKIHCLSTDPSRLRDMLTRECNLRQANGSSENLLDTILSCGDNQELIINKAVAEGFIKLNAEQLKLGRVGVINPRGRELVQPESDMADKLRMAEMVKAEAKHLREQAQLEYETAQLQRKKAEEQARQSEAMQRIAVAAHKDRGLPPTTPTRGVSGKDAGMDLSPPDSVARQAAIARAEATRLARLCGRTPPSPATDSSPAATPPSAKPPALGAASSSVKVAVAASARPPPDAKRPRLDTNPAATSVVAW